MYKVNGQIFNKMVNNVIQPVECDIFIHNIREFQVHDIGTNSWLQAHEILIKFNQQAVIEASSYREEFVKELFITNDKLKILVHEAYCILVWRTKILPKLQADANVANASFIFYSILYHEATVVSLLETLLYHEHGCLALNDSIIDLIDYCVQAIIQLIGLTHIKHTSDNLHSHQLLAESSGQELQRQQKDLLFKIGMKCLTILSFMTDRMDSLMISAIRRMVVTHDIPCLLSEILHCKPWIRNVKAIEKYVDDKWIVCEHDDLLKVTKTEAHVWFSMRNILGNADAMRAYEMNESRQRDISKCQIFMTVDLLDQLPPLIDLKQRLCALSISGNNAAKSSNIILEELPKIKENLLSEARAIGMTEIVKMHSERFLCIDRMRLMEFAQRLNKVYNIDSYEHFPDEISRASPNVEHVCAVCCKATEKKCSRCERTFYCSRECQVKHWSNHKLSCHGSS